MAITINLSVLGDGIYTIEDDGTPGNGTSVVRDPNGNIVTTFAHPADSLTIISRAGQSLNINITDSLTTAAFTVGNIDNAFASQRPDHIKIGGVLTSGTVTLTANETVTEWGSDGATDVVAGSLLVRAGTGIGTGGNFIETQVSALEAESNTGGIAFSNINSVTLEVATAAGDMLRGLWTGTSGNVTLINQGSILLSDDDGVESVRSAGNLQLTAIGAAADISSDVNRDALLAVGNITLSAGRDVLFGTVGTDFDNDVRAGGSIYVTAGRDFHIDGFSDMASDDQGLASNGGVTITVGRDILIEDDNGVDASVGVSATASTGVVILTTGFGGTLSLAANSSAAIQGRANGVIVNADRILIENDSGINVSGNGGISINGASAGRLIDIGSATDGVVALELSDAELDRLVAQNLTIGNANSGQLSVVGAITHTNANLVLQSGADILVQADITTPSTLTLRAGENVSQSAASFITTGTLSVLVDTPDNDGAGGADLFAGAVAITSATVTGNADGDSLRGIAGTDQIVHGLGGNDVIISAGRGQYFGDEGDDTIIAGISVSGTEILDGGLGNDTVDTRSTTSSYVFNMATGATNYGESFVNFELVYTGDGGDNITGNDADNYINTGADNDTLNGGAGADTLVGGADNDILIGGTGIDLLVGQTGNDQYYIDNVADVVSEGGGQGSDRVLAGVSYSLGAGEEIEMLTTDNEAAAVAINLTGNAIVNLLKGNAGANVLNGGGGADTMIGLGGDDWYYVDDAGDIITEGVGEGTFDRIFASVSYAMSSGVQVEALSTTNEGLATPINLTGNEIANLIRGNAGANVLDGKGGADTLTGLGGDDWYHVDNAGDVVVEAAGQGNDRIFASVSYTQGAGVSVETLTTNDEAAATAINLTGNEIGNLIKGNAGANVLNGGGGADTLIGLAGDDWYYVDNSGDVVTEVAAQGNDRIFASASYTQGAGVSVETLTTTDETGTAAIELSGNELANLIKGNAGANVLNGGGAGDTLFGLGGEDVFRFTTSLGGGNIDTISDYSVADDTIQLDDAVFTGLAAGALAAGAFNTGAAATDADDRVIYNSATGALLFDSDGVGGAAAVQFGTISAGLAMTAGEFFVI